MKFDPRVTTYADLAEHAAKRECAQPIFACNEAQLVTAKEYSTAVKKRGKGKIRWVKDNKYYMGQGALKYLPVTKTQATRINADLSHANHWLSPSQRALLKKIKANPKAPWPNAVGKPFARAWQAAMKVK